MESIKPPKTFKVYQLTKLSTAGTLHVSAVGSTGGYFLGTGIYKSLEEAEFNRLIEALKDTDSSSYHIFELEFTNPVYEGD